MDPVDRLTRLGFLIVGVVFGIGTALYSAFQVAEGDWGVVSTVLAAALGVLVVALNWVVRARISPEIGQAIQRYAWPIGGGLAVGMAFLHTSETDIDSLVLPFGAGLFISLAIALATDRTDGGLFRSAVEPEPGDAPDTEAPRAAGG